MRETLAEKFKRKVAQKLRHRSASPSTPSRSSTPGVPSGSNTDPTCVAPTSDPYASLDMWGKADSMLRRDEKKRIYIERLEQLLETKYGSALAPIGSAERRDQMARFTASKLSSSTSSASNVNGSSSNVSSNAWKLFKSALELIVKSKDIISAAAQPCLPASIACAGVMLIISSAVEVIHTKEVFIKGIESLSWSIYRLVQYEDLLCRQGQFIDAEVNKSLIEACATILLFQAHTACYLNSGEVKMFMRDALKADAWSDQLTEIRAAEATVKECADRRGLENIRRIYDSVQETHLAVRSLQAAEEARLDAEVVKRFDEFLQAVRAHTYPYEDRKNRNRRRTEGTCQWFINQHKFKQWDEPQRLSTRPGLEMLYVTADPGCGKSVLSRYLVDDVLPRPGRTVCYTFFKDDFDDQKTALSCSCALLHQILSFNRRTLIGEDKIVAQYRAEGDTFFKSLNSIWKTFIAAAALQETVCVFDALDECRNEDRKDLFRTLQSLDLTTVKLLFTSRPYSSIEREVRSGLQYDLDSIHIQGARHEAAEDIVREIRLVAVGRINEIVQSHDLDNTERALLESAVFKVPNRTYLWITLVFDGLIGSEKDINKQDIMDIASVLPAGIHDAYEKLLTRSTDLHLTRKLLDYVIAAERPLTLAEMSLALSCDNQATWEQLVKDMEHATPSHRFEKQIRSMCGLLVSVLDDKIYLLHQTVREFLLQEHKDTQKYHWDEQRSHTSAGMFWQHSFTVPTANAALASSCMDVARLLTYRGGKLLELGEDEGKYMGIVRDTIPQTHEVGYFLIYWTTHYRRSTPGFRMSTCKTAQDLCTPAGSIAWLSEAWSEFRRECDSSIGSSQLHVMSAWGLHEPLLAFVRDFGPDMNSTNRYMETPLLLAVQGGFETVVEMIVGTGKANVDLADEDGSTPLTSAASGGYEGIVKLLLSEGKANVDLADKYGSTPLHHAAFEGHKSIIQLLIDTGGASIDLRDDYGRTPCDLAAKYGNTEVVKLLTAYDQEATRRMSMKGKRRKDRS